MKTKCEALAKENKIIPARDKIIERDDDNKPLPITYRPCMSFR